MTTPRPLYVLLFLAVPICLVAQSPAPPPEQATSTLPVRRVVLYKTGVGYFEHLGNVRNQQDVVVRFTSAQLDDVLKSLTAIDLGKGQVTGISYNSVAPLEQRLGALRLPLDRGATTFQLLEALRGSRVEVTTRGIVTAGRLLSTEIQQRSIRDESITVESFSVLTDAGEIRRFDLTEDVHVRLADRDLRQEVGRYLDVVGSARERDVRSMIISTSGSGERRLFVSYVSEVPIWKSTYRLVLPAKTGKPLLQGWAIVDNTIGEDWTGVELSLVAGSPQSFIQHISQPYYGQRPIVPLPRNVLMTPQTHQATLVSGGGTIAGVVRDQSGGVLPGATVQVIGPSGTVASAVSDANGQYRVSTVPGTYSVIFSLQGFQPQRIESVNVGVGESSMQSVTLRVSALSESVAVTGDNVARRGGGGGRGGVIGGVVGGLPSAPPPPAPPPPPMPYAAEAYGQLQNLTPAAAAAALGDLFEYRIKEPVTLRKNQSALVPIVNADISAEKVSLWNRGSGSGRPLRAAWLANGSGLTLDGGSISVIDGNAFAGEGLIEPIKPGERRLVSYAADLGLLVSAKTDMAPTRIVRVRARDGIIVQESEDRAETTYVARSEEDTPTTLVIEHQQRPGWKLAAGQKPEESTPSTHRFRLVVAPRQEATLTVRDVRSGETRIGVGEINDALIARFAASGISAADLERALKPVIDKRTELANVERRLEALQERQRIIAEDQARVRENMKALRGSAEERQLLQRYTRQLDEQENELDRIRQDVAKLTADQTRLRGELAAIVRDLSFEMSSAR